MSKQDLEVRRRTAVNLVLIGKFTHRQAADAVGAVPSSISVWVNEYLAGGSDALKPKPDSKVRPSRLGEEQRDRLAQIIVDDATTQGFATPLWTLSRIQAVVEREFDVSFSIGHLHRIVRDLGFSSQKPEHRAREQDPVRVEEFREKTWPELGKARRRRAARS
jgi:transposase